MEVTIIRKDIQIEEMYINGFEEDEISEELGIDLQDVKYVTYFMTLEERQ